MPENYSPQQIQEIREIQETTMNYHSFILLSGSAEEEFQIKYPLSQIIINMVPKMKDTLRSMQKFPEFFPKDKRKRLVTVIEAAEKQGPIRDTQEPILRGPPGGPWRSGIC